MDEFLAYFRAAIERPASVPPWGKWWPANRHRVEAAFDNADFELLRTGKLDAAAMLLRRAGLAWPSGVRVIPGFATPCSSEDTLAALERDRSIRIPDDYRQFLLAYNGCTVQPGWLRVPGPPPALGAAERQVVEFFSVGRSGTAEGTLTSVLDQFPRLPAEWLPVARLNALGSLRASDDLLLLKTRGDDPSTLWYWPADAKRFNPESLRRVAESFTDLIGRLDYPERAKPWMRQIDEGDAAGFRQWADAGGDVETVDPASGCRPIEYAALAGDRNLFPDQRWQNEAGKQRWAARLSIAKLLLERGVDPGHAFVHALIARNFEIARLVPLDRIGTDDLRDAWDRFRNGPVADVALRAAVEREMEARKYRQHQRAATAGGSTPAPAPPRPFPAGPEALEWLRTSDNESALASNRFGDTATAVRFVEELYAAGATRVIIPEDTIQDDGDELLYADALVVVLPNERSRRQAVCGICDREWAGRDADLPAAEDEDAVFLWWD